MSRIVCSSDDIEIGRHEVCNGAWQFCIEQAADFILPLAGLAGLQSRKIVAPSAGVRVDHAERSRLLFHVRQHARQHDVLDHIGKISGVIIVAIVHASTVGKRPRRKRYAVK